MIRKEGVLTVVVNEMRENQAFLLPTAFERIISASWDNERKPFLARFSSFSLTSGVTLTPMISVFLLLSVMCVFYGAGIDLQG